MKVSKAMRGALESVKEQRPPGWGLYGADFPGFHRQTWAALWRRGLVDANGVTTAGREALRGRR